MVIGLISLANHVPIINDLLNNLISLLPDITPAKVRFEGPEEVQKWFEGSMEQESQLTVIEMCDLYDLTVEEISLLRERCRSWNFDGRIDNTPGLTDIVGKIARVDLD